MMLLGHCFNCIRIIVNDQKINQDKFSEVWYFIEIFLIENSWIDLASLMLTNLWLFTNLWKTLRKSFLLLFLPGTLACSFLGFRVGLRILPLLGVIVPRVPLNKGKWSFFSSWSRSQGRTTYLGLEGNTTKILLFVMLTNGKLVISYVVPFEVAVIDCYCSFELIVLFLKRLLQVAHNFVSLPLKAKFRNRLLDSNSKVSFLDNVLQFLIINLAKWIYI
jgi:hypothetical protein